MHPARDFTVAIRRLRIGVIVGFLRDVRRSAPGWIVLLVLVAVLPLESRAQPGAVDALIREGRRAGAEDGLMRTVASRAADRGWTQEQVASILRSTVRLAEQDYPTSLLLTRSLEGFAKRVPPGDLAATLQATRRRTERAGDLVSAWLDRDEVKEMLDDAEASAGASRSSTGRVPSAPDQLIANVAKAWEQGVSRQEIKQFFDVLQNDVQGAPVALSAVAVAVEILPSLPGAEQAPEAVRGMLAVALEAGYEANELRQLSAAMNRAGGGRAGVGLLTQRTARVIRQGARADLVLGRFGHGELPGGAPAPMGGMPDVPPGLGRLPVPARRQPPEIPPIGKRSADGSRPSS